MDYYKKLAEKKEICRLVPKSKNNWVGKKYEDAYLLGFGNDKTFGTGRVSLILLTKIKGKKRAISRTSWSPDFWKVPNKITP